MKKLLAIIVLLIAYAQVNAQLSCPDNHHPHAIDLGLPSGMKWACCNVGSTTPEGQGDYYAWGETETKSTYNSSTYKYNQNGSYVSLGSDIAGTKYDVAHVKWGGGWRMPTYNQFNELVTCCTSKWITINGIQGRKYTGSNGNSIFLPAVGFRTNSGYDSSYGTHGYYWSSTSCSVSSDAYSLAFNSSHTNTSNHGSRYHGLSVRPLLYDDIYDDTNEKICQRDGYVCLTTITPEAYDNVKSKFKTVRLDLSSAHNNTNGNYVSVILRNLTTGDCSWTKNRIQTLSKSMGQQIRDNSNTDKDITVVGSLVSGSDNLYEYTFSSEMEVYSIDGYVDKSMVWLKINNSNISFNDENVKNICVTNWDTNGDGELSYEEAAAVTELGNKFLNNNNIVSFDELKYFTGLKSIGNSTFSKCSSLTSVTIPNSVTSIGHDAFYMCI